MMPPSINHAICQKISMIMSGTGFSMIVAGIDRTTTTAVGDVYDLA